MKLKDWMKQASDSEREKVAEKSGTTVAYLWQLSGGHRKAGALLCQKIELHTDGQVTRQELRPDYFGSPPGEVAA